MSSAATARALLLLRVTSLTGQVRSRLARLRQPKYLAGAAVGIAYVYFSFIRRLQVAHSGYGPGRSGAGLPPELLGLLPDLGALILFAVLLVNWTIPRSASLAFTEAEIAFLFPAPVSRRMLVHYRLLGAQLGIISTALIFTVVFGRRSAFGGNLWFHAAGWWLILATVNLHFTGTAFLYSRLLNRGMTSPRRKRASVAGVWLLICALIVWVASAIRIPGPGDLASAHDFANYAAAQLRAGPLPWLLGIPKLVVAPYFAATGQAFVLALGPMLVVLVAHYFWVLNTTVAFEEASIARAGKRAARRAAVQQGDWRGQGVARSARRPAFRLAEHGRPELAFLWKNLLATSSLFRPRVAVVVLVIVLAGSGLLVSQPQLNGVRLFAVTMFSLVLGMTLLLGPLLARQDLRADLANADLLKSYPLRGWQIVAGELLTPLSMLTGVIWVCLLGCVLLLPEAHRVLLFNPWLRGAVALSLAVIAPPLVAIQLLVPNAAAVLFPAWTQSAGNRGERGIEVMGQRVIFMVGQVLITLIATVPAALGAGLIFFAGFWLVGVMTGALLAAAMAFLVLCAEVSLGVLWLGGRFEHFDLSA